MVAGHDHAALPPSGELAEPRLQLPERDEHGPLDAGQRELLGLADVEQQQLLPAVAGPLELRRLHLGDRSLGHRHAAESLVVRELAKRRIHAARRTRRILAQAELPELHA